MTADTQIPNFRNDLGIMPSQLSLRLVGRGLQPGSSRDRLCQGSVAALGSIFPDRVLHSSAFNILELEPLPLLRGWQDLHLCDLINPDLINHSRHRLVWSPLLYSVRLNTNSVRSTVFFVESRPSLHRRLCAYSLILSPGLTFLQVQSCVLLFIPTYPWRF